MAESTYHADICPQSSFPQRSVDIIPVHRFMISLIQYWVSRVCCSHIQIRDMVTRFVTMYISPNNPSRVTSSVWAKIRPANAWRTTNQAYWWNGCRLPSFRSTRLHRGVHKTVVPWITFNKTFAMGVEQTERRLPSAVCITGTGKTSSLSNRLR